MSSSSTSSNAGGDLNVTDEIHHDADRAEVLSSKSASRLSLDQYNPDARTDQPQGIAQGVIMDDGQPQVVQSTTCPVHSMYAGIPDLIPIKSSPSSVVPGDVRMETSVPDVPMLTVATNFPYFPLQYVLAPSQFPMPQLIPINSSNECPTITTIVTMTTSDTTVTTTQQQQPQQQQLQQQQQQLQQQQQQQEQEQQQQEQPTNKRSRKSKKKEARIKKPLNAFMFFMKENRQKIMQEHEIKECSTVNQILGQEWNKLDKTAQAPYYEMAKKESERHMQMYPNWTARENYGVHKKRKPSNIYCTFYEGDRPPLAMPSTASTTTIPPSVTTTSTSSSDQVNDPVGIKYVTTQKYAWCDPNPRRKPHNDNENNEEGSSSSAGTTAIDNTTTSNVEDASTLTKVSKPAMSSGSHQKAVVMVEDNNCVVSEEESDRSPSAVATTESRESLIT